MKPVIAYIFVLLLSIAFVVQGCGEIVDASEIEILESAEASFMVQTTDCTCDWDDDPEMNIADALQSFQHPTRPIVQERCDAYKCRE